MDPQEENPLKQIRTFQGDVAEALRRQQESLVSIQRREHLKNNQTEPAPDRASQDSKKKAFLIFFLGSLVLFVVGVIGTWFIYNEFIRKTTTPTISTPLNRFLPSDTEIDTKLENISREVLIDTISNAIENVLGGELRHIILPLSTADFLQILKSRAPGSLVRAFDPLFMFGALGENNFLIIKLVSFENAFAGMLSWEKNIAQDIGPLFATSRLLLDMPAESIFTDMTDRNKDLRVLTFRDQILLLYSFFDNNMLIIADNIETFRTIIERLTREKLSR